MKTYSGSLVAGVPGAFEIPLVAAKLATAGGTTRCSAWGR